MTQESFFYPERRFLGSRRRGRPDGRMGPIFGHVEIDLSGVCVGPWL